jgi:hypothetical protein
MTIVRELVTKLGFQVDKTGLEKFEKSIIGFKTKFALLSAGVTAAVSKTLNYFKDIANAAQDTEFLAKQTGIATEKFVALRRAAEDFQLPPEKFDAYFGRLGELLREGEAGAGKLFEILRNSRGLLNLKPFIKNNDVEGAFKAIIDYTASLNTIQEKTRALTDIFGDPDRGLFAIVEAGSQKFAQATEKNKAFGQSFVDNIPKTKEYSKVLNEFYKQLEAVQVAFVENILPAITKTLEFATEGFKGIGVIKQAYDETGLAKTADFVGQAIADSVYRFLGYEPLVDVQNRVYQEDSDFYRRLGEYQKGMQTMNNSQANTITNNVEVNVPAGTLVEQAQNIGETVKGAMQQFWDEKTREITNNNPQAE